jgi:membrane-associated phospholipid phosphatase
MVERTVKSRDPRKRRDARRASGRRRNTFLPVAIGISGGVGLSVIAFWFFKQQAEEVVSGRADLYDEAIMDAVHQFDSPKVNRAVELVTHLGSHAAIATAAGVTAIAMISKRRPHDAWTVVISTSGAMALNSILKAIFARQRPQELARQIKLPKSHSFPSGHSLLSAATYPIVAHHLVQHRSTKLQAVSMAAAGSAILSVGFSRIYLGVHFPSDVLGGFAAGLGWLGLTSLTHTLIDRAETKKGARASLPRSGSIR